MLSVSHIIKAPWTPEETARNFIRIELDGKTMDLSWDDAATVCRTMADILGHADTSKQMLESELMKNPIPYDVDVAIDRMRRTIAMAFKEARRCTTMRPSTSSAWTRSSGSL